MLNRWRCLVLLDFPSLDTALLVVLLEVLGELLVWWDGETFVLPEVWGEEGVGRADSLESGLGEVSKGGGGAASRGVAIFKTGHLHKLLGDWTANETSSSGSGDESDVDGTTLAVDLRKSLKSDQRRMILTLEGTV